MGIWDIHRIKQQNCYLLEFIKLYKKQLSKCNGAARNTIIQELVRIAFKMYLSKKNIMVFVKIDKYICTKWDLGFVVLLETLIPEWGLLRTSLFNIHPTIEPINENGFENWMTATEKLFVISERCFV